MFPTGNSIDGPICSPIEWLVRNNPPWHITYEIALRIKYNLIGFSGSPEIMTVFSSPVALDQCENYLAKLRATTWHKDSTYGRTYNK